MGPQHIVINDEQGEVLEQHDCMFSMLQSCYGDGGCIVIEGTKEDCRAHTCDSRWSSVPNGTKPLL